jgi:hypothetical protein
MNSKK